MADLTNIFNGPFRLTRTPTPPPPETQLLDAILSSGIDAQIDHVILDGQIHRFSTGGKKDKSGWYIGYADGVPAGRFGCWRAGVEHAWQATTERTLDAEALAAIHLRMAEAKKARDAERERDQAVTADVVAQIWALAAPADDAHPYLARKGIAAHGARVTGDGRLIVPLYNADGQIISVQYIAHDGEKRYHPHGSTKGGFCVIGDTERADVLYIAEGFATAATVHQETGAPCVAAYSAGNLPPVAQAMRAIFHSLRIVIVADNDAGGIGAAKAEQACALTGATYVMPPVVGKDANDWVQAGGSIDDIIGKSPEAWIEWGDALTAQPAPLKWLVNGWMPEQCLGMLHGPSGAGKTFIMLDMMLHVVTGRQWNDRDTKQGCVVYLAGEGNYGIRARLAAWKEHHKAASINEIGVSKCGCDLNTPDGFNFAVSYLREVARTKSIRAIVVDTLHRFLSGDENSAQDAKTMIDACDRLKREFNASVWLVHHTGLSETAQNRARGSSAWRGALDVEIGIKPNEEGDGGILSQFKMKDAERAPSLEYNLKRTPITGWVGDDNEQVHGAVVEWFGEVKNKTEKQSPLSAAIDAFRIAWHNSGTVDEFGRPSLNIGAWREYLMRTEKIRGKKEAEFISEQTAINKTKLKSDRDTCYLARLVESGKVFVASAVGDLADRDAVFVSEKGELDDAIAARKLLKK